MRVFAAQPDLGYPDRREGLSANGRLQLSRNWYTSGSVMFDLSRHLDDRRRLGPGAPTSSRFSVASMSVGLGYVDECTSFQVTYTAAPRDGSIGSKDEEPDHHVPAGIAHPG